MAEGITQPATDTSERLGRLYELALTVAGNPIEVFDHIVRIIAELFGVRVALVEAEEIITEERVWPIIFPSDPASPLTNDYIINLELVRSKDGWQIAACGFAYPPGTDV